MGRYQGSPVLLALDVDTSAASSDAGRAHPRPWLRAMARAAAVAAERHGSHCLGPLVLGPVGGSAMGIVACHNGRVNRDSVDVNVMAAIGGFLLLFLPGFIRCLQSGEGQHR